MTGLLVVVLWSVSDTMGGPTIRRLANPGEMDASVQRIVIQQPGESNSNSIGLNLQSRACRHALLFVHAWQSQ